MTKMRDFAMAKFIKPYATMYDFTVIYFSEFDLGEESLTQWKTLYEHVADVKVVNTRHLGFQPGEGGERMAAPKRKYRYGYNYMCKFFALDMYEFLQEYDYYLRCDTDCIFKTISHNIFDYVISRNIEYGYALRKIEAHKITRDTLPHFVTEYLNKCSLTPTALMDGELPYCFNFYNNFHIGKVSFFRRPDVQHFLHSVNDTGMILSHRWGDSTIQAYTVRVFMNPASIQLIPNISYVHGSHGNSLVTSWGDGKLSTIPQMLPHWSYEKSLETATN